jgi:glutamate N-acetyltransferase/amino-acid N-acetyltransferase
MPEIEGLRIASGACGLRYKGRSDIMLAVLDPNAVVAGCFTKSLTASSPVDWCKTALKGGRAKAIIVNSGNANAFTGKLGSKAVDRTVQAVSDRLNCSHQEVFVSSTGVIGEPLDVEKLVSAVPKLVKNLKPGGWKNAAKAIMTTDTFPKGACAFADIAGRNIKICGIAKGSGMIAPDMATMLSYIFTDAKIDQKILQSCLKASVEQSFNAVTVDGDTSTSDTVLLCATGTAGNKSPGHLNDPELRGFRDALNNVTKSLAQQIVRDGEGASKFVTISVSGAKSNKAAKVIAMAIANSPLVKTAIAGCDPNWGRIVMAVGKSGEKANRDSLEISIGGIQVTQNGFRKPDYDEAPVATHMSGRNIDIGVDVGIGRGRATVWTCDLTHDYIRINADYRS